MHPAHELSPAHGGLPGAAGNRLGVVGAVLVVIGFVLCMAYRFTAANEPHSYAADAVAPYDVSVTQGHQYHVAVHGGVVYEQDHGLVPAALACTYSAQPGADRPLTITAEQSTSKATNVIAAFRAPVTGSVHVGCTGLTSVFVDDADDSPFDRSGLYLLFGVVALTIGVPLLLSALRTLYGSAGYGEDD